MKPIFSSRRNKSPHNNEEAEKRESPFFSKENKAPFFNANGGLVQAKLTVGQPGDKYEKEADSMADAVVSNTTKPDIQNREISSIQRESLATPLEDEKLGTAEQRMEEDKLVQEKPEIQRMDAPEEKEEEGIVNKMNDKEEEEAPDATVQTKSDATNKMASSSLSGRIENKSGKGKMLPKSVKSEMETSFQRDFSDITIHTGTDAVKMNKELGAQAFTHGKDVYFNSGKFDPDSTQGKHLLAHELTHVVQQTSSKKIQKQDADKTNVSKKVVVIGSPSPAEIRVDHPYQFVNAARYQGVDENTVWIVERTGYDMGNVDLNTIREYASPGRLIWLTPDNSLPQILNGFPEHSIGSMSVFSHGVPGAVTLRYGWGSQGAPNYGLSLSNVHNLKQNLFEEEASIRFDSCNTGTSDFASPDGNLAQQFADRMGRPVEAWTGRTSYSEVNDGTADGRSSVEASQIYRGSFDSTELASQYVLNRDPVLTTFQPPGTTRVGGFDSYFQISARLPSTREFEIPSNGSVVVRCPNPELVGYNYRRHSAYTPNGTSVENDADYNDRVSEASGRFWVKLYKNEWFTDPSFDPHTFEVETNSERAIWTGLEAGTYYLEIYRLSGNPGIPIRSDIHVDVYSD